ncbi:MAG: hypothetical protein EA422_14405 [Gemmatimonadales bacterium]|nr:MAG: hypothetical protein EA422_14405 [Gemmatimonadales bacterium]
MPVDVRVESVVSRVRVADPDALLTPEVLERIVQVVLARLEEREAERRDRDDDQSVRGRAARL